MATRDQDRAAKAYEHVSTFTGESDAVRAKKYGSMVHKLPSLLQSAGLCQALHFVQSRGNEEQKKLVEHLAEQLRRVSPSINTGADLLARARQAPLGEYLALTDEAMACAAWYRRLVQGVLKVDPTDDGES
jgi:CRISPR type III-B/RAMP module-associated protein Cmr5